MDWGGFHHPDLSLPVIRRRAAEEWLDLMLELGDAVASRGWSVALRSCYPSRTAYHSAIYRLRKRGLIAYRREGGQEPVLMLTPAAEAQRRPALCPERWWDRKWNRIWYLLVYDVPEHRRAYRSALRQFLRRMRMGCLQRSVWVSPHDVRPDFDDLVKAGGVDAYAYLFEARTVLGLKPDAVVNAAWPWPQLQHAQEDYCQASESILDTLHKKATCPGDSLLQLARLDLAAYLRAMHDDPLLPRILWPPDYLGAKALRMHRAISREIQSRL